MPGMYDLTLKQLKLALEQSAQEGYQLFPESRDLNNWNRSLNFRNLLCSARSVTAKFLKVNILREESVYLYLRF